MKTTEIAAMVKGKIEDTIARYEKNKNMVDKV